MNARIILSVILVIIVIFVGLAYLGSQIENKTTMATSATLPSIAANDTSASTFSSGSNEQNFTTLENIIAGKYPTALDKNGTNGVIVSVKDLKVLDVQNESDGDWHVSVTDGKVPVFITEITPLYQAREGRPPVGSTIDETGFAYCDTVHQTEAWHGNTCWEIHPVTAWHASNATVSITSSITKSAAYNPINLKYGKNPIARGSAQTINVTVFESAGANENVPFLITYATEIVLAL